MKRVLFLGLLCVWGVSTALVAQGGHMGHPLDKNLIFPHFVLGGGVQTQIILMNPQPGRDLTGTLFFFGQDGTPFQVVNNGQSVTQLSVSLPAEAIQFVNVSSTSQDAIGGWALFEVSGPGQGQDDPRTRVFGSVTFQLTEANNVVGAVGVVAGRYELGANRTVAVPVVVTGTTNTGVALVNAGSAPMTLTFQLKNEQGVVVQQAATITPAISPLAPGNQAAVFVTELFEGFDFNNGDFRGTLTVSTQQEGLVVTGLLQTGALLTSIPVVLVRTQGPQTQTVTDVNFTFSPAELTINAGDSVQWQLANIHNVVEVTEQTWNGNGSTAKAGGFSTGLGGGTAKFDNPGTYFYVCSPHAFQGMKGKITVNPAQ